MINSYTSCKVIFKLDDLNGYSNRVKILDDFIKKENIKVCWGIIGKSLESKNDKYLSFLIDNNRKNYSFFNHGYYHHCGPMYEFFEKSIDKQYDNLKKTQDIVKKTTNISLDTFGAPANHIDNFTSEALNRCPEIRYWFFGLKDSNYHGKCFDRLVDMERTVGKPSFHFFASNFLKYNSEHPGSTIVLQGHPNLWDASFFYNFVLIVKFLKKVNCSFVFPEEV